MLNQFLENKKALGYILGFNILLRLIIIALTNLGNDEVYYVTYALYPDWSYFDHPPMLAYLLRLTTLDATLLGDFFVRLGPLLVGTANLCLIYSLGRTLKDHQTGVLAALMLSASIYATIITGTFILPDTPQSICWLLALYFILPYFKEDKRQWRWLAFGVMGGLALLSKYHAVYLWGGMGLFLLKYRQRELLNPYVYIAGILSLVIFTPVLVWNYYSDLSGLNYHANRIGGSSWLPSFKHFFPEFFGQIFYNNPFNIYLIGTGLVYLFKKRGTILGIDLKFLLFMAFPLMLTTLCMAMYNHTLPHWSGPSYFAFILLAAFAHREQWGKGVALPKGALWGGNIFLLIIVVVALLQMQTAWVPLSSETASNRIGRGDFTIDLSAWEDMGAVMETAVDSLQKAGVIDEETHLLTHNWFPAAHIDKYFAIPNKHQLYVLGGANRQHHYMYIHQFRGQPALGTDALYITTSHYHVPVEDWVRGLYEKVEEPLILPVYRNGRLLVNIYMWRLSGLKSPLPLKGE